MLEYELFGTILSALFYMVMAAFIYRIVSMSIRWLRKDNIELPLTENGLTISLFVKIIAEVVSLVRLLRVNEWLWIGQWLFHVSMIFVFLRHLRYVLSPVPQMLEVFQQLGIIAGYVMFFAVIYILVLKIIIEKKPYISPYNMFLLALFIILAASGLMMKTIYPPDVIDIKVFMLGIVAFNPQPAPESMLFIVHFAAFLLLLLYVPSHIIAAPQTIADARIRDESLVKVIHG